MGPKPVKVGDEIDVTIEAVAAKGDGIAKKDGFVIFVPGAAMGETCKVKVTDVRRRFAIAQKAGEASAPAPESQAPAQEEAPGQEDVQA
ncbi:TRAM domain-containing protein [Candidatus Parvarchaeota archaeon]|nr:TRAM domain-containing protein [Candidatus Parvarchaeota archaeon]